MAKNSCGLVLVCALLFGCGKGVPGHTVTASVTLPRPVQASATGTAVPENAVAPAKYLELQRIYLAEVGVREATGKNDGARVEEYLRSTGLGSGYPWCASFVRWCLDQAQIPSTVTAWSPTAENGRQILFKNRKLVQEPRPGDVVTFYYANLGRIGHTGFYNRRISDITYESVEGNTNSASSREGDGVYIRYRSYNSTHSISRWE